MASIDLDPLFVKALKLLNSKSKDSAAQLKAMLDEAIAQRKGLKVPAQGGDAGKMSPARSKDEDYKRKEADKRSLEKGSKDPSEPDPKKSKLDSKHRSKDEKEAREKEREKEKARRDRKEKEEKEAQRQKEKAEKEKKEKALLSLKQENEVTMVSDDDEGASSQLDAGDFALEMGIACVVCKQFGVSSGNQLLECQECHSLYHQECHKPPVSEETVNDPRYVWYCSRCQKMLQKKQQQATQKPVAKHAKPSASLVSGKDVSASMSLSAKPFKTESSSLPVGSMAATTTSQAFRKIDPKVIVPPKETNSQSKPILGLAGLAANLTKPQSKSGSTHRKSEQKGGDSSSKSSKFDSSKPSSKVDSGSHSSRSKTDEKRSEKPSSSDKERKHDSGSSKSNSSSSSSSNRDEKKSNSSESSSKSSSSSSAFDKSEKKPSESGSKSEKKFSSSESNKSSASSSSSGLRLDLPSQSSSSSSLTSGSRNSPSQSVTPETPDSPSVTSSKLGAGVASSSSDKNKKAMAALSIITANKRMQMMMKKASEKKVHIK